MKYLFKKLIQHKEDGKASLWAYKYHAGKQWEAEKGCKSAKSVTDIIETCTTGHDYQIKYHERS